MESKEVVRVSVSAAEAEVYREGCTVVLRGFATLRAGANHLVVDGLPDGLDEASVSLRMPESVTLGQVLVTYPELGAEEQSDELTELDHQIDELDRQIENKQTELEAWKGLSARMSGPSAMDYLEHLPARLDTLTAALMALKDQRRDLAQRRDRLREEALRPHLEADVISTQEGAMPLELCVRSSAAGWSPAYDVLVDRMDAPLRLRLKGQAWQQTGMDWQGVTLRLSTGTAAVMGDLPRFAPRYLRKEEPLPVYGAARPAPKMMASSPMRSLSLEAASPAAASADDTFTGGLSFDSVAEMSSPEAQVEQQATATTYELTGSQSLASAPKAQTFAIMTRELAASYRLYTYPRGDEAAYLVAHLDEEPAPDVLERPLSVYLMGSYAGTIRIGRTSDDEGYELPLGRDALVRVRRIEDVRRSKKLLGGKVLIEHTSSIVVESRKDLPMKIVVLEQVPVSQDKEIEVVVKQTSGAAYDADRGELRWEHTLEAGGRLDFSATYEVSHAKGIAVYERTAPASNVRTSGSRTYCANCGAPVSPSQTFCPTCGARMH